MKLKALFHYWLICWSRRINLTYQERMNLPPVVDSEGKPCKHCLYKELAHRKNLSTVKVKLAQ